MPASWRLNGATVKWETLRRFVEKLRFYTASANSGCSLFDPQSGPLADQASETRHLPAERTGVQPRAPEGARRATDKLVSCNSLFVDARNETTEHAHIGTPARA